MSLLDKFKGNFVDNDDDEELDEEEGMEEEGMPASPVNPSAPVPPRSQAVRSSVGRAGVPVRQTSKPYTMVVVSPKEYADAEKIADHLKAMRPVVMNIEKTDDDEAERIVDFVQGVMYALDGRLDRISDKIYLCAPSNVSVSQDSLTPQPEPQAAPEAPQGEQEIFSVDELVKQFSMNRVSSNDAVFDIEKLNWINFQYMKQLTPDQLLELTLPFIEKAGYVQEPIDADKKEWLKAVVWYVRDHLYYGAQAPENVKVFFEDLPALQDPELLAVMKAETSALIIKSFAEELKKLESFDADSIKSCFTRLMKETKVKGKAAFEPVRIALTGVTHGPGLYDMIALFGKEKAVKLLEDALAYCSDN